MMRAYEFLVEFGLDRKPVLSGRARHNQRCRQQRLKSEEVEKAPLLVAMYSTGRYHELEMQEIERQAARIELERQALELAKLRQEYGSESRDRVKAMALRTAHRHIKD